MHRSIDFFVRLIATGALVVALPLIASEPASASDTYAWPATRAAWTEKDERGYETFVQVIAASECKTVGECLAAPANPLAADDPPNLTFSADCADLVYMLRAYYAWKKGLPFGFVSAVEAREPFGEGDLRATRQGNRPASRWDVTLVSPGIDIREVFHGIRDRVSTATFRIDPRTERPFPLDFYSPAITREALRPGSAIYNGEGHVVILSHIDDAGRIHFLDAHPDMSVTRGVYGGQFERGDPALGAGFHVWRPFRSEEGRVVYALDAQIPDFSMEQYFGPAGRSAWRDADYSEGGRNIDFLEFTRRRLAKSELVYDLVGEFRQDLEGLCDGLQDRVFAVAEASLRDLWRLPRPGRLQGLTAEDAGIWLAFSTPGRDRRLRRHAVRTAETLKRLLGLYRAGSTAVSYTGNGLRRDLQKAYNEVTASCEIAYVGSNGDRTILTMRDALDRLPDMSFDPYHCPERRWAASGDELKPCDDGGEKARWYVAQAPLRHPELPPGAPANPTLAELGQISAPAWLAPDFDSLILSAPKKPRKAGKR